MVVLPVQPPSGNRISLASFIVSPPAPPPINKSDVIVVFWFVLTKFAELTPSKVSASKPEPAPSTVLISVRISLAVWSAVADDSIPSNFVPSVATSRPSTVPVTAKFPVKVPPELDV